MLSHRKLRLNNQFFVLGLSKSSVRKWNIPKLASSLNHFQNVSDFASIQSIIKINLLGLGWWSAVTVGVETGVFLFTYALAAEDVVAAVTEALIGFGCFFGDPPSVTVGPTDCERPTKRLKKLLWFKFFDKERNQNLPFEIFLGLFCGLPFIGLPCRELIVFCGLPRCGLPVFDRGNTGINFSLVGDGNKAPSSTSKVKFFSMKIKLHHDEMNDWKVFLYLDRLYVPNDVEQFHVSIVHKDCPQL